MKRPKKVKAKLLDCPFCGGKPTAKNYGIGRAGVMVGCDCGVLMTAGRHSKFETPLDIHNDLKKQTIKNWNTRKDRL